MRNLVTIIFIMAFLPCIGQSFIESESFISDNVIEKNFGLPTVRRTGGGSKILVQYEGNWTNEMKGAFEYACKKATPMF